MHTFLSGPEFCFMVRKLFSSCTTSKNITLNEQYPELCDLLQMFPTLCAKADYSLDENNAEDEELEEDDIEANDLNEAKEQMDVMQMLLTTQNVTIKTSGLK